MGRLFSPDSGLAKGLSYVGDMMVLNILFLLCSLPVVTIGASGTALFTVASRMAKDDHTGIVSPFFRAFRENFWKATAEWLLLLSAGILIWLGSGVVKANPDRFPFAVSVVYVLAAVFLWLTVSWVFPVQAKFENTVFRTIKNAFILGMAHPARSIALMLLTALIPGLCVFATYWFLATSIVWFLFGFSGIAILESLIVNKVFNVLIGDRDDSDKGEES